MIQMNTINRCLLSVILILPLLISPGKAMVRCTFAPKTIDSTWVDSVLRSLTLDEKIGQLMMMRTWSDKDSSYYDSITRLVKTWNLGGLCFFKGTPYKQVTLINHLQETAKTPLLFAIDAEWGLGMRLDSAFSFPKQMMLGAITDDSLIYRMGCQIAKDCKRVGLQINFAPVVDINNNPNNPVINLRSFGENKYLVARKSSFYMSGLRDNNIMAVAKHFPGHGDTDTDSHLALPVLKQTRERMDSVELFPFRELIKEKLDGIMVAHLYIPAFDTSVNIPATLSRNIITGLLRDQLGFQGTVITDALDMHGVTKLHKPGEIEVKALLAGNDILLLPQHIPVAVNAIRLAVDSCLVPDTLIDYKCRKILQLKYKYGLAHPTHISTSHLYEDLNPVSSEVLSEKMIRGAVTLVKDPYNLLPLSLLDHRSILCISVGDTSRTTFQKMIGRYSPVTFINLPQNFSKALHDSVLRQSKEYNLLIFGIHRINSQPEKKFGISDQTVSLIDTLSLQNKVLLDLFGSPYALSLFRHTDKMDAILVSYQDNHDIESVAAQQIFGGIPISGKLPVTAAPGFPSGTGIRTPKVRLEYVTPEETGISSESLASIDSIAMEGIAAKAYPGCQVLFAIDGKVFYQKSFGHFRYDDSTKVINDDLYDLASVTKVAGTTLAIMKLYEDGKISLDEKLVRYLPGVKGSDKESLTIREIMAHQAGLQSWIPFYLRTLKNGKPDSSIYRSISSENFPYRVAENIYIRKDYHDSIYKYIIATPLLPTREYKYSDMGFYLLKMIVERISGQTQDAYLRKTFYDPMGLTTMGYSPRDRFPVSRMAPTENDVVFRRQVLQGDVHDPGAAMLGGVAGHAGLFSGSNDLAVLLQMLVWHGEYGGKQYLLPSTVKEFTRVQYPGNRNRRGLGFDKPLNNFIPDGPSCQSASPQSFGHSGFTGTYIWADPENGLVYVFLSNRVYPDASNQKLEKMNIRTRIHQAMYDILECRTK
jgi:beta-N-acetylhexosaminidase